jgi:hypothetical protein
MSNMLGSKYNPANSLRSQANAARSLQRRGGGMVKGRFDRVKLGPKSFWLRFNPKTPSQYYCYQVRNAETNTIEEVRTLWFRYISHFARGNYRGGTCSAGAARDKACWGCAYVDTHWDRIRKEEKETGVRRSREDAKPKLDTSPQFAFGVTYMEDMYAIPVMENNGQQRQSRNGQPLVNYLPKSLLDKNTVAAMRPAGFGRPGHLSVSQTALDQLLELDDYVLRRHCLHCAPKVKFAREMPIVGMQCPEDGCPSDPIMLDEPVLGEDAIEAMKDRTWRCTDCAHIGQFYPVFSCECGKPTPGDLTSFDVRIKKKKGSDGEKGGILEIVKIRFPDIRDKEVEAMVMNSLELEKIFAPTPIDQQAQGLGDLIKGIPSPMPRKRNEEAAAPPSSPYDDVDSEDKSGDDSDEADFD